MDESEKSLYPMKDNYTRDESQMAEYELAYSDEDLADLSLKLSDLEKNELDNLSNVISSKQKETPFFKDLINVVIQGSIDYVNAITDVSDVFDDMKNSSAVNRLNDEIVSKKNKPATSGTEREWQDRTIQEAQKSPFDKNASCSTTGMSSKGIERLGRYQNAYIQRTKSLTQTSTGEQSINRQNFNVNAESLAGIESYRFGPIVPPTPISELKLLFDQDVAAGKCDPSNRSAWIRKHNYDKLDRQLMETFGFKTKSEAQQFRKDNNLTPHEGPNGICLIPSDIHDSVSHNGYATKAQQVISGELTEQEMTQQIRTEKIQICKHELKQRGTRMAKGMFLSLVKDVVGFAIGVVGRECYQVFKQGSGKFIDSVNLVMRNVWNKIKTKILQLIKQLKTGIVGNVINEILTAINDFIFKTAKNIFRIIRMMWKSLYNALKTIFSSQATWGERLFEATKILAAGIAGVLGITLNELIEKGLTSISIPFAPIFADILSGLFGGILSAVMLFMFDKARKQIFENSHNLIMVNVNERLTTIRDAKLNVMVLTTDRHTCETIYQFGQKLLDIRQSRSNILNNINLSKELNVDISTTHIEENDKLLNQNF